MRVIVYSLMASVVLGWWQKALSLLRAVQQSRRDRWVEPSNEVTRAIFSGGVPSLPSLAPAAQARFEYGPFEAMPEVEVAPAAPSAVAQPEPAKEAAAVAAAPGRAGRAA